MANYTGKAMRMRVATRIDAPQLVNPPPLNGAPRSIVRSGERRDVPGFINPAPLPGVALRPTRKGVALRENFLLRGTLRDSTNQPLAGWRMAVGAGIEDPESGGIALLGAKLTTTDEAGGFSALVQRTGQYNAIAWKEGEHIAPLPCEVTSFDGLDVLDLRAPVTFQRGKALIQGTTTPLRNTRLAWTDPEDKKAWQGTMTDEEGAYELLEEQRAYEVFAIQYGAKTQGLFILGATQTNADGTRDLLFQLVATGGTIEFSSYTPGFVKKYSADGTFRNLPPEWDCGGGQHDE